MHLSQKFVDFTTEELASVPYIVANAMRLKVSTTQVTDLGNFSTAWGPAMTAYTNPGTHTPDIVMEVNNQYHDFHPYLEGVKQQLKNDKSITLLTLDIATINIHVDAARRVHVGRPGFAPTNSVTKTAHLVTEIATKNPDPAHIDDKKLPDDVAKIGRKIAVVPAGSAAPALSQYHNLESIGTTNHAIVFNPDQGGATAYLITWYLNARGEAGPPSEPLVFQILGMPVAP